MKALSVMVNPNGGWDILVDFLCKYSNGEPAIEIVHFSEQFPRVMNGVPELLYEDQCVTRLYHTIQNVRRFIPRFENLYVDNPLHRQRNHEGAYGIVGQVPMTTGDGRQKFQRLPSASRSFPKDYIWTKGRLIPKLVIQWEHNLSKNTKAA